jgi:hypothetical protein
MKIRATHVERLTPRNVAHLDSDLYCVIMFTKLVIISVSKPVKR